MTSVSTYHLFLFFNLKLHILFFRLRERDRRGLFGGRQQHHVDDFKRIQSVIDYPQRMRSDRQRDSLNSNEIRAFAAGPKRCVAHENTSEGCTRYEFL